ncbi:MAG: TrmB family transcriptional regulator [Candidatus Magasanikbacteria bacterium]
MELEDILEYYGLDNVQIKVYKKLVKVGESRVPDLVDALELSRASIYDALKELQNKNLIVDRKEGRKTYYKSEHPDKLHELVEDKKREMKTKSNRMKEVIDKLKGDYMKQSNRPGVRVFEGKEGFKEAMYDNLEAEEIYSIVDVVSTTDFINEINKEYVEERKRRGIKKKMLIRRSKEDIEQIKKQGSDLSEVRILPESFPAFDSSVQIYNNKVGYFTLREEQILAVIINDPAISQMNKNIFEHLWQQQEHTSLFSKNKDEKDMSLKEKMESDLD